MAVAVVGGARAKELWRCWQANPILDPLPEPAEPATDTLRVPPKADFQPDGT